MSLFNDLHHSSNILSWARDNKGYIFFKEQPLEDVRPQICRHEDPTVQEGSSS